MHKLIAFSSAPLKSVETNFATDSSGFRTTKFNEYCNEKHNERKRHHEWVKAHVCTGTKTNIITSAIITQENGADCPQFIPLAQNTINNGFVIGEMSADLAYSSRNNVSFVAENNGVPYIPFKKNATGKPKGKNHVWRKMFHYFNFNKDEFLQHYHSRSNVESTFNMVKAKFGDSVKSKNWTAQQNELLAKILCHNIVVVIHEMYELGIEAKFT